MAGGRRQGGIVIGSIAIQVGQTFLSAKVRHRQECLCYQAYENHLKRNTAYQIHPLAPSHTAGYDDSYSNNPPISATERDFTKDF